MEQSPAQTERSHAADTGRVAVPEIAELLHLQRPAAVIAAAVVVLVGLLVALVLPAVLPPNAVTGFVVGLLALFAGAAAAVVLDGRDPVVRGPRHLRRDGHTVLARMAGPDPVQHAGPVLSALQRRLDERNHLSIAITGSGTDPSELAEVIGRGAAGAGHTSLVVDLRATGSPGVADVGAGKVRLGEAATLADDRPYAWIAAGADRAAAVTAAAGVARRPPRDLELLLVVAPEAATHTPELLRACDRTLLLVAADTQQRAMVSARLDALERAGGTPEAVVVGGLQVGTSDPSGSAGTSPSGGGTGVASGAAVAGHVASTIPPMEPEEDRPTSFTSGADEGSGDQPAARAPVPPMPPPVVPDLPPPTIEDVGPAYAEDDVDVFAPARGDADEPTESTDEPDGPVESTEAAHDGAAVDEVVGDEDAVESGDDDVAVDLTAFEPTGDDDAGEDDADGPPAAAGTEDVPPAVTDPDTAGPIRPIPFRTTSGDVELDGFAASDPLVTTAALEQLLRRHDGDA